MKLYLKQTVSKIGLKPMFRSGLLLAEDDEERAPVDLLAGPNATDYLKPKLSKVEEDYANALDWCKHPGMVAVNLDINSGSTAKQTSRFGRHPKLGLTMNRNIK